MLKPDNFLPTLDTNYVIQELSNDVSIYRDKWGIPHIKSNKPEELFFAQGFVTAQDRLFQMDLDRLRCLGKSSEYLGKKGVSNDKLNLSLIHI